MKKLLIFLTLFMTTTVYAENCEKLKTEKDRLVCQQFASAFESKACPTTFETPICEIIKNAREANCSTNECREVEKFLTGAGTCENSLICKSIETVINHPLDLECSDLGPVLNSACLGLRAAFQFNDEDIQNFISNEDARTVCQSSFDTANSLDESDNGNEGPSCRFCENLECHGCGLDIASSWTIVNPVGNKFQEMYLFFKKKIEMNNRYMKQTYVDLARFKYNGEYGKDNFYRNQSLFFNFLIERNKAQHFAYDLQRTFRLFKLNQLKLISLQEPAKDEFEALNRRGYKYTSDIQLSNQKYFEIQNKLKYFQDEIEKAEQAEKEKQEDRMNKTNIFLENKKMKEEKAKAENTVAGQKRAEIMRKLEENRKKRQDQQGATKK